MRNSHKLVEVYIAKNEMEARVIKGLLESFGIPSMLKSHAAPSIHQFTVDGLGEVRVMVMDFAAEKARGLIEGKTHV